MQVINPAPPSLSGFRVEQSQSVCIPDSEAIGENNGHCMQISLQKK